MLLWCSDADLSRGHFHLNDLQNLMVKKTQRMVKKPNTANEEQFLLDFLLNSYVPRDISNPVGTIGWTWTRYLHMVVSFPS